MPHLSQPCAVMLGDMLDFSPSARDMHVGKVPTLVNNQTDIIFAAERFIADLVFDLPPELRAGYAIPGRGPYDPDIGPSAA